MEWDNFVGKHLDMVFDNQLMMICLKVCVFHIHICVTLVLDDCVDTFIYHIVGMTLTRGQLFIATTTSC